MGNKEKTKNNTSNDEMIKEIKEESIINDKDKKKEEKTETEVKTEKVDEKPKQTKLEDNQYKVSCGRFADENNNIYEFGEIVTLTKKQVERYIKLNIIGNQLRK